MSDHQPSRLVVSLEFLHPQLDGDTLIESHVVESQEPLAFEVLLPGVASSRVVPSPSLAPSQTSYLPVNDVSRTSNIQAQPSAISGGVSRISTVPSHLSTAPSYVSYAPSYVSNAPSVVSAAPSEYLGSDDSCECTCGDDCICGDDDDDSDEEDLHFAPSTVASVGRASSAYLPPQASAIRSTATWNPSTTTTPYSASQLTATSYSCPPELSPEGVGMASRSTIPTPSYFAAPSQMSTRSFTSRGPSQMSTRSFASQGPSQMSTRSFASQGPSQMSTRSYTSRGPSQMSARSFASQGPSQMSTRSFASRRPSQMTQPSFYAPSYASPSQMTAHSYSVPSAMSTRSYASSPSQMAARSFYAPSAMSTRTAVSAVPTASQFSRIPSQSNRKCRNPACFCSCKNLPYRSIKKKHSGSKSRRSILDISSTRKGAKTSRGTPYKLRPPWKP